MVIYVIQKNGGNENSPDSLNVMVNYHYHSEKRVITIYAVEAASPVVEPRAEAQLPSGTDNLL